MDLYKALQGILDKVRDTAQDARTPAERSRAVLDNQTRLGEAILIIGGLLQMIIDQEISVQVETPKDEKKKH